MSPPPFAILGSSRESKGLMSLAQHSFIRSMQNTSDLFTPSSARPWDGGWHQSFREPMWIYISIIVAVVVLLLNLKSLPLVYHVRPSIQNETQGIVPFR